MIGLRARVIALWQDGQSQRSIAKTLCISPATVQSIEEKFKIVGNLENQPGRGHKRKTTARQDRSLIKRLEINPRSSSTAAAAAKELEESFGLSLTPQTIRNCLHEANLHGRTPRNKPYISPINREKRLEWAKKNVDKPQEFWDSVIWSDESKFNLFGSDGAVKIWRKPGEELELKCLNATVKHGGGNIMVWGCIVASGVGKLAFIDQRMDQYLYKSILKII